MAAAGPAAVRVVAATPAIGQLAAGIFFIGYIKGDPFSFFACRDIAAGRKRQKIFVYIIGKGPQL